MLQTSNHFVDEEVRIDYSLLLQLNTHIEGAFDENFFHSSLAILNHVHSLRLSWTRQYINERERKIACLRCQAYSVLSQFLIC